jgi:hypothetical protein
MPPADASAVNCFGHGRRRRNPLFVQALDGRQRHAVGIDGGDAGVALAQAERGLELLRPRAGMADGRIVSRLHRQPGYSLQHCPAVHGLEVVLRVAVAPGGPTAGARREESFAMVLS